MLVKLFEITTLLYLNYFFISWTDPTCLFKLAFWAKLFFTIFTFEWSFFPMNCCKVNIQATLLITPVVTHFTNKWFLSSMSWLCICSQIILSRNCFFHKFLSLMNWCNMFIQVTFSITLQKWPNLVVNFYHFPLSLSGWKLMDHQKFTILLNFPNLSFRGCGGQGYSF